MLITTIWSCEMNIQDRNMNIGIINYLFWHSDSYFTGCLVFDSIGLCA